MIPVYSKKNEIKTKALELRCNPPPKYAIIITRKGVACQQI
jgi:hypothetical protein